MITQKQVNEQIETLDGLANIVRSFEEIAASRMQRIRKEVLSNREFLEGLSKIYHQVRVSYREALAKHKTKYLRENNGKTVRVLVSANTGLYGPIVKNTYGLFAKDLKASEADAVVIGRLGRVMLEREKLRKDFTYFSMPDQVVGYDQLREIVEFITRYRQVIVYHGLFKNILSQPETATDISGGAGNESEEAADVTFERWIFEPSLDEVVKYFETEIFTSFFVHTVHEAQLAKFASRMVTLDEAGERVKDARRKAFLEKGRLKHLTANHKLISGLAGISLWGVR